MEDNANGFMEPIKCIGAFFGFIKALPLFSTK